MHETIVTGILSFVAVGVLIQVIIGSIVAFNVFGRGDNKVKGMVRNYVDAKTLERYYKFNKVKD